MSSQKNNNKSRSKKPGQRKPFSPAKHPDTGIVYLTHGRNSNLMQFQREMVTKCNQKFGDLTEVITDDSYPDPEEPDPEQYQLGRNLDPHGINRARFDTRVKAAEKQRTKYDLDKRPMFGFIWEHLSRESADKLRRRPDFDSWNNVDPLRLWREIKATHGMNQEFKTPLLTQMDLLAAYNRVRQRDYETLLEFYERFVFALDNMNSVNTEEYPQQRAALDFFERLHPKLMADFKSTLVNEANKGIKAEPTTVSEMYQRAEAHVSAQRVNPQKPAAAFKTKGKQKNKKQDQRSDDKSDKDGTHQEGNGSQNNVTSHNNTKLSDVECFNCHEMGHYANNCPEQSKARVNCSSSSSHHDDEDFAYYEVMLDNQANMSIVDARLLNGLHHVSAEVTGVTGHTEPVEHAGYLEGFFKCLSSPNITVSVLCQADVEELYDISYVPGSHYTVHMDNYDLNFFQRGKMYVANMEDWIVKEDNDRPTDRARIRATVAKDRKRDFTPSQIKRADKAYEFVVNSGFASERDIINMVNDGSILNLPFTAEDVRIAFKIYGKPRAAVRGKMTQKTIKKVYADQDLQEKDRPNQKLYSDVMYVATQPYLLSLAEPLQLISSVPLRNNSAAELGAIPS